MLAFDGFPNVLWQDNETKIDFTINVVKDYQIIYEKKMDSQVDKEKLFEIASEANAAFSLNKDDEQIYGINFIEFLIWIDEKFDKQNVFIKQFIQFIACVSEKTNMIEFFLKHPEKVERYNLKFLIDNFWKIDLNKYNNADFFALIENFCLKYDFDYKEKLFIMLKNVLPEKAINLIKENFNVITYDDLANIIYFATNQNNVQEEEYFHMCVLKNIIDFIMEKK